MDNEQEQNRGSRLAGGGDGWLHVSPHHESETVIAWDGNSIPVLYRADCPPNVVYVIPAEQFDRTTVDSPGDTFYRFLKSWEHDAFHYSPDDEDDD